MNSEQNEKKIANVCEKASIFITTQNTKNNSI